jgi:hypothetical protein
MVWYVRVLGHVEAVRRVLYLLLIALTYPPDQIRVTRELVFKRLRAFTGMQALVPVILLVQVSISRELLPLQLL